MVIFGYLVASVTQSEFNWPYTATWLAFMIVAALAIALLNFRGVRLSARTGTILGTFEVVVFVALALWLIIKAGSGNTGAVFTLHFATIKGFRGFAGIAAGSIYTILAFIGFEASAPLAEEARNPRRTSAWRHVALDGEPFRRGSRPGPVGSRARPDAPVRQLLMDRLGEIRTPALLVGGRYDECRPAHLAEMHRRIAGSQLAIIEDASHLCFAEQPEEFTALVNSFLDRIEAL